MKEPHKSLAECKDEVAEKHGFENWRDLLIKFQGTDRVIIREQFDGMIDEAYELHASQFIKKDETEETPGELPSYIFESDEQERIAGYIKWCAKQKKEVVSSDVEQAAKDYADKQAFNYSDSPEQIKEQLINAYLAGNQSTQQPATINWLTDDEIETHFPIHSITAKKMQILLKERVNCVDLVGFVNWTNDIGKCDYYPTYEYVKDDDPIFVNWCNRFNEEDMITTEQLLQIYLTPKTNPNGS